MYYFVVTCLENYKQLFFNYDLDCYIPQNWILIRYYEDYTEFLGIFKFSVNTSIEYYVLNYCSLVYLIYWH